LALRFGSLLLCPVTVAISFRPPRNGQCLHRNRWISVIENTPEERKYLFVPYCSNFNDARTARSKDGSPMVWRLFSCFPGVGLRVAEE
jgi:hypothetical protein